MKKDNANSSNEFVEKLIEEKGIKNQNKEVLAQIKTDLLDRVENRINAAVLANLPAEKLEELEKMINQSGTDEIQAFCRENIVDIDQIIATELADFRRVYLNI